jgi:hypothetical protein
MNSEVFLPDQKVVNSFVDVFISDQHAVACGVLKVDPPNSRPMAQGMIYKPESSL